MPFLFVLPYAYKYPLHRTLQPFYPSSVTSCQLNRHLTTRQDEKVVSTHPHIAVALVAVTEHGRYVDPGWT